MTAARAVFVLRRGLFGYRRRDVLAALDEQRSQIESLEQMLREERDRARGYARPDSGSPELDAARRLDEISTKLDRLIEAEGRAGSEPLDADPRPVYVAELGDLREIRERRLARGGD